MDIAAWLRSLGLERHEEAFRANEIDWEVLPELSEADLEKLGLPLGPRKKLLKAIAGLSEGTGPAAASPAVAAPVTTPEAERRQLTVMFCDLVGSTALSERLDAEELGDLIRAYHERVSAEVRRFEGHVAKYMGDGVLAYFGWPRAHEDDAERAIRAGLAIVDARPRPPAATGPAAAGAHRHRHGPGGGRRADRGRGGAGEVGGRRDAEPGGAAAGAGRAGRAW